MRACDETPPHSLQEGRELMKKSALSAMTILGAILPSGCTGI